MQTIDEGNDFYPSMKQIRDSNAADVDKLAQAFDQITNSVIEHAQHEIELARAMYDHEAIVKHQIKMEAIKSARGIFQDCFLLILGRRTWDE